MTGFRVGKDGVHAQSYTPPSPTQYVDVTWPTIIETDTTGGFSTTNGTWTAQADGTFLTGWGVWNQAGVGAGGGVVSKMIKNGGGALDTAAIAAQGFYPNTAPMSGTMRYRVVSGDVFKISNYCWPQGPTTQINIDPRSEHTYWWGEFFPD